LIPALVVVLIGLRLMLPASRVIGAFPACYTGVVPKVDILCRFGGSSDPTGLGSRSCRVLVEVTASPDVCQGPADASARGSVTTSARVVKLRIPTGHPHGIEGFLSSGCDESTEGEREGICAIMYAHDMENSDPAATILCVILLWCLEFESSP
jgi:hypothetical protein